MRERLGLEVIRQETDAPSPENVFALPERRVPGLGTVSNLHFSGSPPRACTATTVALKFGGMRQIEISG
jgi:hypothetical protein